MSEDSKAKTLLYVYREYVKLRQELKELKEKSTVTVSTTCSCGVTTIEERIV